MKKIINSTLVAVVLSVALVGNVNARVIGKTTGTISPDKLSMATKQLERCKVDPNASEPKVIAQMRKTVKNVEDLIQKLANLRNWSGDLGGRSIEEIQEAMDAAMILIKEVEYLNQQNKQCQTEVDKLATQKYFGFGKPDVKEENETEYTRLMGVMAENKKRLEELKPAVAELESIIGEKRSRAIRNVFIGIFATVGTIAIDKIIFKGAISQAGKDTLTMLYNQLLKFTPDYVKNWSSQAYEAIYGLGVAGAGMLGSAYKQAKGYFGYGEEEPTMAQKSYIRQLMESAAGAGAGAGTVTGVRKGAEYLAGRKGRAAAKAGQLLLEAPQKRVTPQYRYSPEANQARTNQALTDLQNNPGLLSEMSGY
jgi:hypothetical protein